MHDERMLATETQVELEKRANELGQPRPVIGPLMTGSWGIIAGGPGSGKSMFVKMLIKAIASDKWGTAGDWRAETRKPVLLIDAEMSPTELAGRYCDAAYDHWLKYTTLDLLERLRQPPFSLGNVEDQFALKLTGMAYDVIVIDNIEYTLDPAPGVSIFAPETWAQVEPLTRWAKSNDKLLIFVDHTNKEGGVQGSLSKQRGASFVISLIPDYVEGAELAFKTRFTKFRGLAEDRALLLDRLWWFTKPDYFGMEKTESNTDIIVRMSREGKKPKEMANATGLKLEYIYNIRNKTKHLWHEIS